MTTAALICAAGLGLGLPAHAAGQATGPPPVPPPGPPGWPGGPPGGQPPWPAHQPGSGVPPGWPGPGPGAGAPAEPAVPESPWQGDPITTRLPTGAPPERVIRVVPVPAEAAKKKEAFFRDPFWPLTHVAVPADAVPAAAPGATAGPAPADGAPPALPPLTLHVISERQDRRTGRAILYAWINEAWVKEGETLPVPSGGKISYFMVRKLEKDRVVLEDRQGRTVTLTR